MAEEGVPPPTVPHTSGPPSGWDSEQVAQWMLRSAIPGKEEVADALREEEVDGFALLRYAHKLCKCDVRPNASESGVCLLVTDN